MNAKQLKTNNMKLISASSTETLQEITIETGFWIFKKQITYRRAKKSKTDIFRVTSNGVSLEAWFFWGNGYEAYALMKYLENTNQLK